MPPLAPLPVLAGCGAAQVSVFTGHSGTEAHAALAVGTHTAVLAQAHRYVRPTGADRFHTAELGGGYFTWPTPRRFVGLYGGLGHGQGESQINYIDGGDYYRTRYTTAWVLPMIAWHWSTGLEAAFGLKLISYYFHQFTHEYGGFNTSGSRQYDGRAALHLQPAAQLSYALAPQLLLTGRLGAEVGTVGPRYYPRTPFIIASVGLAARLGPRPITASAPTPR